MKRGIYIVYALLISVFLFSCADSTRTSENVPFVDEWKLVWSDEFDQDGLPDDSKWSYDVGDACDKPAGCGWGNHELQYYTDHERKNARIENGHLIIEVLKEKISNSDYSSARLVSKNKGDWKYGKFEIKAKLPDNLGIWSAIWMLSSDDTYRGWPHSGEIDIMENVGFDADTTVASAHTLSYHHSINTHKNGKIYNPSANEMFHVYTLEWDENKYSVSLDEKEFFTFKNEGTGFAEWPFDQKFHIILNVAYGGDWGGQKGIDPESLPAKMLVDYVRVYQKPNQISQNL